MPRRSLLGRQSPSCHVDLYWAVSLPLATRVCFRAASLPLARRVCFSGRQSPPCHVYLYLAVSLPLATRVCFRAVSFPLATSVFPGPSRSFLTFYAGLSRAVRFPYCHAVCILGRHISLFLRRSLSAVTFPVYYVGLSRPSRFSLFTSVSPGPSRFPHIHFYSFIHLTKVSPGPSGVPLDTRVSP